MIRIALSDDQELFIESVEALFTNTNAEVEIVWTARTGEETLEKVAQQPPDVLVLDYFFKGKTLDGAETCHLLRESHPQVQVLILSVSCEINVMLDAFQKGAKGYASKDISKSELLRGIQMVANGEYFLDQVSLSELIYYTIAVYPYRQPKLPKSLLTRREIEVAHPYAKGKSVREIAQALFISEDTVESHIKNIRSKIGATSRYDVAEWMKKHKLWAE